MALVSKCRKIVIVSLCGIALLHAHADDRWSREQAEQLFSRWCEGLLALQLSGTGRSETEGALICPACGFLHGRAGDSVYPFVRMWVRTGERKWLDAAERVVEWTERNFVREGGCYVNDQQSLWLYTSEFSQIALGRTLLRYGDRLPPETKAKWRMIFDRLSEWMLGYFKRPQRPNVNYRAAYCESMALAWNISGDARFRAAAERMVQDEIMKFFTSDGFLFGEGDVIDGRSPVRGLYYIDIGYNLEESLPALAAAAEILGDEKLAALVEKSALAHAEFLLPDGAIDNAAGSRAVKWTYYGSRTSDGALPLWAWCARRGVPWAVRAIDRTLSLLSRCTGADGLLAGGPDYAVAGEPSCVHHTFTHVKSVVELLEDGAPEQVAATPLPREVEYGHRHIDALDVELVSIGPWRVTFSANDCPKGDRRAMSGGGAPVVIWHKALGLVSAGAMAKFYFIEPSNMQAQRHDLEVRSLVPRIESVADEGAFSNLCDAKVSVKAGMRGDVFVSETAGRLASWKPGREVAAGTYRITYRVTRDDFSMDAHSDVPYRLVLPVRTAVADRVCLTTSSQPHAVDTARNGDAFSPVGGFLVRYMAFLPDGDGKSAIAVSLTRKLPRENCCKGENSLIKCISPLTCGNVIGYNTIDKFGEELCH